MKKFLFLIFTFMIAASCKENNKSEKINKETKTTELKSNYEKVVTNNWLDLKYKAMNEDGEDVPFHSITKMAEFPGGYDSLANFIKKTIEYPETAVKDSIIGRVSTTFFVDTNGNVKDVEVVRGVRKDLDSVCYNGISLIPNWKPAESKDGKKIMVQFLLPIRFLLETENEN